MKRSKDLEKIFHNRTKKSPSLEGLTVETRFKVSRNVIRKACFQMTLNARRSPEDSLLKIKTDYNRAKLSESKQNSETSRHQPVNVSETSRDTASEN